MAIPENEMPAKTRTRKPPRTGRYSRHPMLSIEEKAMKKLAEDTGRDWDAWVALARRKGPRNGGGLTRWLMHEHGLPRMRAYWIVSAALAPGELSHDRPEPLVDALYSGTHAGLRPLHEKIVDVMLALGDDVIVTACKTMVPVYRKHVFADLRPVDGTVQVQLALADAEPTARLELARARSGGDRLTHRVRVRSAREIDATLKKWIAQAYANGAKAISRSDVVVEVPAELAAGLKRSKAARETWDACTAAMRRDMIGWIAGAVKEETRSKRAAQALEALSAGRKRVY